MLALKDGLMAVSCISFLSQRAGDRTMYELIASAVAIVVMNGPGQLSVS